MNYSRRAALKTTVVTAGAGFLATGCEADAMIDRKLMFASLDEGLAEGRRLAAIKGLNSGTVWTLPQTLVHLAQSIEFSIAGYPRHRSEFFQRTVGSAAFSVFSWRGRMSHNLGEPIPGAPSLNGETDASLAIARLQTAVQVFNTHSAPLAKHFAYGTLDKTQYEQAHAMHLAEHFSVIDA